MSYTNLTDGVIQSYHKLSLKRFWLGLKSQEVGPKLCLASTANVIVITKIWSSDVSHTVADSINLEGIIIKQCPQTTDILATITTKGGGLWGNSLYHENKQL